jgi:hypothetical protein
MIQHNWRQTTVEILANRIGPSAGVIVDDIIKSLDLDETTISNTQYADILMRLTSVLPRTVKPIELCEECRNAFLVQAGSENSNEN